MTAALPRRDGAGGAGHRAGTARLFAALLLQAAAGAAPAADANDLVLAHAGDLPILLTAPHGGRMSVPGAPLGKRGITTTDGLTFEMTEALARHLQSRLGRQPYVVAARFSRKYIDANRAEAEAFDSPAAKPAYDAYHGRIRSFILQIRERFPGGGLLIDIHGQSEDPGVVHRGTRDGATTAALLRRHGPDAVGGPSSLLGVVQAKGFKVFPPPGAPIGLPPEDRRFRGGYTVHAYGSRSAEGLDAIQIEVGRDLRRDPAFIAALAEGIAVFHGTYLEAKAPR
jgi:N-formylglutamate amidohydrolase